MEKDKVIAVLKNISYNAKIHFDVPVLLGALVAVVTSQWGLAFFLLLSAIYLRLFATYTKILGVCNVIDVLSLRLFNNTQTLENKMDVVINVANENGTDAQKLADAISKRFMEYSLQNVKSATINSIQQ